MASNPADSKDRKLVRADASTSVLVVESDPIMLMAMGGVLDMNGHRAVMARDESMAQQSIREGQFDLIVLSIDHLDQGCAFAARLRAGETTRDIPVIFITPPHSQADGQKLAAHGGVYSIVKPLEPDQLIELVDKALVLPHIARGKNRMATPHLPRQSDWVSLQ